MTQSKIHAKAAVFFLDMIVEVEDETLEFAFFSDDLYNFPGFHARWSVTGTSRNFSGEKFTCFQFNAIH